MESHAKRSAPPHGTIEQVPVDPDHATLISFEQTLVSTPFQVLRALATGTWDSAMREMTESWFTGAGASSASATANLLMTSSVTEDPLVVAAFIDSEVPAIVCCQLEGTENWAAWERGDNSAGMLFKARDPDGLEDNIGFYFAIDALSGKLTNVAWYRTVLLRDGLAFTTTPASLLFEPVLDSLSAPSTDPNDIFADTWYFSKVMPPT